MKILSISFIVAFSILFTFMGRSQQLDNINKQLGFHDQCFDVRIKSVQLYKTGNSMAEPIIKLSGSETVTLSFDEIDMAGEGYKSYEYSIEHCDADWKDEGLVAFDYMNGFPVNPINDYQQSVSTDAAYINYTVTIPNNDVSLKLSGNYLLKVVESSSRKVVLQKGFSVVEPIVGIQAKIRAAAIDPTGSQQLELLVNHGALSVNDAFVNLKVRVTQNSIPYIYNVPTPVFTQPGQTDYTRPDKNIFPGVNEFRPFDFRNLSYNGQGVNSIKHEQGLYYIVLNEDKSRADDRFMSYKDANGTYLIGADRVNDPNTGADYADVYFALSCPRVEGKVFIFGELSNWSLQNEFEMHYVEGDNRYSNSVLLKQGYYNYRYVVLTSDGKLDMSLLEGNHYETENSYSIYVYFRAAGDRFDRLVGFERVKSN